MPSILVIGGDGPKDEKGPPKKAMKARSMIGGDEPEADDNTDEESTEPMDNEAQKLEAAKILFPDNPKRAAKALEAFIYACKE